MFIGTHWFSDEFNSQICPPTAAWSELFCRKINQAPNPHICWRRTSHLHYICKVKPEWIPTQTPCYRRRSQKRIGFLLLDSGEMDVVHREFHHISFWENLNPAGQWQSSGVPQKRRAWLRRCSTVEKHPHPPTYHLQNHQPWAYHVDGPWAQVQHQHSVRPVCLHAKYTRTIAPDSVCRQFLRSYQPWQT